MRTTTKLSIIAGVTALGVTGVISPPLLLGSVGGPRAGASTTNGAVYAWFDDDAGQLGNGLVGSEAGSPTPIPSQMPSGTTSFAVAAGQSHSLAVTSTGAVYAFGFNGRGQLGTGSTVNSPIPVQSSLPSGVQITAVAAGWDDSLALTSTGSVYAWGMNKYGELGDGTYHQRTTPVLVHFPAGVTIVSIAAGQYHSLAVSSTGTVYAWGYNGYGQLGNGTTVNSNLPGAVSLPAGEVATSVGAGDNHSLVVTSAGDLYAWGRNTYGQLGNGTTTDSSLPVQVQLPAGVSATSVTGGGVSPTSKVLEGDYSLAVTSTGSVYSWGFGGEAELGTGNLQNSSVPTLVQLPSGVVATAVGAGPNYGHALTSTGAVYYWGTKSSGKHQVLVPAPTPLPSGLRAYAVSAGPDGEQILAIMAP
jgi:alpha-tubulin suppressor-like RCC1 family protein